jgi:hypothetical protein
MQCLNNVRQLGLALQEFTTDHHFYPPFFDPTEHSEIRYWGAALDSQMGLTINNRDMDYSPQGVWHCPAASRPPDIAKERGYAEYGYNSYGLSSEAATNSLGLSGHYSLYKVNGSYKPTVRVNESEVVSPSDMIAIGDAFLGGPNFVEDGQWLERVSKARLLSPGLMAVTKRAQARQLRSNASSRSKRYALLRGFKALSASNLTLNACIASPNVILPRTALSRDSALRCSSFK